ncbi:DUF6745 domain-containing protein [Microbispora triticiradicis]|uniref:DUF6745 domain-containing protein n=1 Tax=Microbispora triticiradicis TaxID=2200763 RepID=UPI001AD73D7D|nr:hypothetical protein [Microbispora triticiradicis]MBO4271859.1 hypothetical protein [Microbispora triticiradicis]
MDARTFAGVFTEEHEALVAAVCDEWTDSGLSTEPVDRRAAERAVGEAYRTMGLEPPRSVVWAGSPAGCLRACVDDESLDRRGSAAFSPELVCGVRGELRRRYRSNPWTGLEDRLESRLRDAFGPGVWEELRSQIACRIREPLWERFGVRLRGHVLSGLSDRVSPLPGGDLGGVQDVWRDAYRMALYTCAVRMAGMRDERLEALAEVTRHLGWWVPSRDGVIVSERPEVLLRDELERLHCASGPALSWPDGFALHAWHGTPVPGWVVTDPTPEAIGAEGDPEIRRCAIESFGWERYIAEVGLPLVAEIEDPRVPGSKLALYDLPEHVFDEPLRVLVTTDAQARNVYLLL